MEEEDLEWDQLECELFSLRMCISMKLVLLRVEKRDVNVQPAGQSALAVSPWEWKANRVVPGKGFRCENGQFPHVLLSAL